MTDDGFLKRWGYPYRNLKGKMLTVRDHSGAEHVGTLIAWEPDFIIIRNGEADILINRNNNNIASIMVHDARPAEGRS